MSGAFPLWTETSRWLEAETGLHFARNRWSDMERGLAAAAARLGFAGADALAAHLLGGASGERERQIVAECLAIGETYFFREPALFEHLRERVLAPLVRERAGTTRHLRLWSAACSTGEEAYTLAMLLATLLPDWRDWNISILATDFNPAALAKAQAAVYGAWSLRGGVPPAARQYLHQHGGRYEVDPALRRMVRFARLNLVKDAYPSAASATMDMDLVLCRNVLIYFEPARSREILARLGQCLADGGCLVTSSVEVPTHRLPGLTAVTRDGVTVLQQRAPSAAAAVAQPAPPAGRRKTATASAVSARPARVRQDPPPALPPPAAPAPPDAKDPIELAGASRASADSGELARAEQLCREAIGRDKLNPELTYLLSSILCERGDFAQAARALQRTLYLDPQHLLARFALGSLALRQGKTQAARKHLTLARARLADLPPDEVVSGSGGLSAAGLAALIERMCAS